MQHVTQVTRVHESLIPRDKIDVVVQVSYKTLLLQCSIVRNSGRESQTSQGCWNHLGRLGPIFCQFLYFADLQCQKVESTKWLKHKLRATVGGQ